MNNNKMKIITSVVTFKTSISDLDRLISSYSVSLNYLNSTVKAENLLHIVDNDPSGSSRGIVESLAKKYSVAFKYTCSLKNGGYGHGHNLSIFSNESDFHIVCNPDIVFMPETIHVAVKYMNQRPEVGLLTPSVYSEKGARQHLNKLNPSLFQSFTRRFVPEKFSKIFLKNYLHKYEMRDKSYDEVIEDVPFCTGCFMFFRTSVLKKINGFDENFFMYYEDADISRRALSQGKNIYLPSFKVIHRWERASHKNTGLRNAAIVSAVKYSLKWGLIANIFRKMTMLFFFFELLFALTLLIVLSPVWLCVALLVKAGDGGKILYWSERVGLMNQNFMMPKFRTMKHNTPKVATHLLENPDSHLTVFGKFLRKTSLDELPQLISIIKGDMRFVGPRPALFNQYDLIESRTSKGVQSLKPGITGWAQVNGRDAISIDEKATLDEFYLNNRSFIFDVKIIFYTVYSVVFKKNISH